MRRAASVSPGSRCGIRRFSAPVALLSAFALVFLFAAGACGGNDDETSESPESEAQLDLVIGALLPLTGDLADFGEPWDKAAGLAAAQIDTAIEEAGVEHTVELNTKDSQTDPQAAVSAARLLVSQGATCLSAAPSTAETIPVAEAVTVEEEVVQITPGSTSDDTTKIDDNGYVFRTILPNRLQGPALADVVERGLGGAEGRVVNVGARNDAYGTGLADTFVSAWEEKGGEVGAEVVYDPELPSYNSEAQQLVEGDPDGWVIIDFPETFGSFGPALVRTGGWDPAKTFVPEGLYSATLPDDLGQEVTEGIRGTTPGSPDTDDAGVAFNTLYKEAPPPDRRQSSDAQQFDAIILCYLAAVAAGSTDGAEMVDEVRPVSGPPGEKYTFEQLPAAIEALENGEDIDYEGASGAIDLDEAGDPTAGVYDLFRYEDGELVEYAEVPIAEGEVVEGESE